MWIIRSPGLNEIIDRIKARGLVNAAVPVIVGTGVVVPIILRVKIIVALDVLVLAFGV